MIHQVWLHNDSWRLRSCWLASPMLWSCALLAQQAVPFSSSLPSLAGLWCRRLATCTWDWMFPHVSNKNIKQHQDHQDPHVFLRLKPAPPQAALIRFAVSLGWDAIIARARAAVHAPETQHQRPVSCHRAEGPAGFFWVNFITTETPTTETQADDDDCKGNHPLLWPNYSG